MPARIAFTAAAVGLWLTLQVSVSVAFDAHITIRADQPQAVIDRNVYGHFVEHLGRGVYEGIWVGEESSIPNTRGIRNDVVAALKKLRVPVVRWPGGCFADDYHWRDGIGPRAQRAPGINGSWGNVPESNAFGTHEFMDFVEQIGAQPYLSINVGSGTPQEAQAWMQYLTAEPDTPPGALRERNGRREPWQVPFIGVGNENWGCGGNMRAEFYADQYRLFVAYLRHYSGDRPFFIAGGADADDYAWTETLMSRALTRRPPTALTFNNPRPLMSGLSLHFYTLPTGDYVKKGEATGFSEERWMSTLKYARLMDELVTKHSAIMDRHDPEKKVALVVDEWGTWFDPDPNGPGGLYQQNTLRDALVAGIVLNIFHRHADRVRMANIAQMINVLQAMILTDKEKMLLTPTYHIFDMYQAHQGATSLPVEVDTPAYRHGAVETPALSVSSSRDLSGKLHLSIVNLDPHNEARVVVSVTGAHPRTASGQVLTAAAIDAHNTFDRPSTVRPRQLQVRPGKSTLSLQLPAKSVSVIALAP